MIFLRGFSLLFASFDWKNNLWISIEIWKPSKALLLMFLMVFHFDERRLWKIQCKYLIRNFSNYWGPQVMLAIPVVVVATVQLQPPIVCPPSVPGKQQAAASGWSFISAKVLEILRNASRNRDALDWGELVNHLYSWHRPCRISVWPHLLHHYSSFIMGDRKSVV